MSNNIALELQLESPSMVQDEVDEVMLQSASCYRVLLNKLKKQKKFEDDTVSRNRLLIAQNTKLVRLCNEAQNMRALQSSLQNSFRGGSSSTVSVFNESQNYNDAASHARKVKPDASETKNLPTLKRSFKLCEIWSCLNGMNNEIRNLYTTRRNIVIIRDELSCVRNSNVTLASTVSNLRKNKLLASKEEHVMDGYSDHVEKPSVCESNGNLERKGLPLNHTLEISKMNDRISDLKLAIQQKKDAIDVKSNEIASKRQKIEDMVRISTKLAEQNRRLNTSLNRESEAFGEHEALVKTMEDKIQQLQEKSNYITESCSKLQGDRDQLQMRNESLQKEQNQPFQYQLDTVDIWFEQKRERLTNDFHKAIENFLRLRKMVKYKAVQGKAMSSCFGFLGYERPLQSDHLDLLNVSDSTPRLEDLSPDQELMPLHIQGKNAVESITSSFQEKSSSEQLRDSLDQSSLNTHPFFNHKLSYSSSSGQNFSYVAQSSQKNHAAKGYETTVSKPKTGGGGLLSELSDSKASESSVLKSYNVGCITSSENSSTLRLPIDVTQSILNEKTICCALSPVTPGGITTNQEAFAESAEANKHDSGSSTSTIDHSFKILPDRPESRILSKDPMSMCVDVAEDKRSLVSRADEEQTEVSGGFEETGFANQSLSAEESKEIVSKHLEPNWDNIYSEIEPTAEASLKNVERWKDRIRGRAESAASLERYDVSLLPKPYDPSKYLGNDTRAESNESIQENSESCADIEPTELLSSDLEEDCNRSSADLVSEDDFCEFTQVSDSVKSSEHLSLDKGFVQKQVDDDSGYPSEQGPDVSKLKKQAFGHVGCCSSHATSKLCNNVSCSDFATETLGITGPSKSLSKNQGVLPVGKSKSGHDLTLEQRNNDEGRMDSMERDLGRVKNGNLPQETLASASVQEISAEPHRKSSGQVLESYGVLLPRNSSYAESSERCGNFKTSHAHREDTNQGCSLKRHAFMEKKGNGNLNNSLNTNVSIETPRAVRANYIGDDGSGSLPCSYPKTSKLTDLVGSAIEGNCTRLTEEFITKNGVGTENFSFEPITNPIENSPTVCEDKAAKDMKRENTLQGPDRRRLEVEEYDCDTEQNSQKVTQTSRFTMCKQKGIPPTDAYEKPVEGKISEARVQTKDFSGGETITGNEIKRCAMTELDGNPSPSQQFEPVEDVLGSKEDSVNSRTETNATPNANDLEQNRGMSLSKFVLGKHGWAGFFRWC